MGFAKHLRMGKMEDSAHLKEPIPHDILSSTIAAVLKKWLSIYVIETTKQNGQ